MEVPGFTRYRLRQIALLATASDEIKRFVTESIATVYNAAAEGRMNVYIEVPSITADSSDWTQALELLTVSLDGCTITKEYGWMGLRLLIEWD